MSFHEAIEPEPDFTPFSVYWTPAAQVDARDVTDLLRWAVSTWDNRGPLVFLQADTFYAEDGSPIGRFEAAMNETTGEICGVFAISGTLRPIWTSATPGDWEDAMRKVHDSYVKLGILTTAAGG